MLSYEYMAYFMNMNVYGWLGRWCAIVMPQNFALFSYTYLDKFIDRFIPIE